jgi:ABC-type branched-subunit amino acid transport system substrate-binding protein
MSRLVAVVLCALALAGCPGKRHTLGFKVPTNGDPEARSRFLEAQAQFRRDGSVDADEFAAIAEDYPDDPIAPYAQLYTGMAMVTEKDYAGAEKALAELAGQTGEVDKGLVLKARLYLGIARNYQGEHTQALPMLANAEPAAENDKERGEWLAAISVASAAGERPLDALPYLDRWYGLATPAERGFILARVTELVAAAPPDAARDVFGRLDGKGPGVAILGYRVAADREASGDTDGANDAREKAAPARKAVGLPLAASASAASPGGGEPGLIGAVLPQLGKQARVGELAVQGLAIAASASATLTVDLRTAAGAEQASAAMDELAAGGVIAVIGPIDGESVDAAANRANALHVPMLSLSPTPERRTAGAYVFHAMHSAEHRARVLARRAVAGGVKSFAMLSPESGYGRSVSTAFAEEVARLGGAIASRQTYADDTKSFASLAKKLGNDWQAVFVADQADKLELVAPALAAAGQIPKPLGTKKAVGGRPVLLLSTAEGLSPDYVVDAGRHSEGALLAPGFFPDARDATIGDFITAYTAAVGKPPAAVDAYAYDMARAITATGAGGRSELVARLAKLDVTGVTGTIRFDERHLRADDGLVFTVEPVDQTFEIHALR